MTFLMLTTGRGVAGFTLDPTLGEFVLTHPQVRRVLGRARRGRSLRGLERAAPGARLGHLERTTPCRRIQSSDPSAFKP